MEELELPFWGLPAGFAALLIIAWIGLGILWNKRYRPGAIKKGKPTPTFNNALGRALKFILKEDVNSKSKLGKLFSWRNVYVIHILLTFALLFLNQLLFAGLVFLSFFILAFGRVKKVFAARNRLLTRMFEVAHSEFKYPRGTELNPWSSVVVHKWSGEDLATPEKITVSFPPAFRSDDPRKRQDFEKHFDGTVAKDNIWTYSWDGAAGTVECEPVPHLPTMVKYPGSTHRSWDEIPLGQGIDGEIIWKVTDNPHILVCGTTGGGKAFVKSTPILSKKGWTTVGELEVGDILFDENGQETTITAAHKFLANEPVFEITFSDGETITATSDHLWFTETADVRASKSRQRALGDTRKRTSLLPEEKKDELRAIIESSLPTDTISIAEAAKLAGVDSTSRFLFDIAKRVGPAEIVQEQTSYHYKEQDIQQNQKVSVYDAKELKAWALDKARKISREKNPLYTPQTLTSLKAWADTLYQNDKFVETADIAEALDLDHERVKTAISGSMRGASTKDLREKSITYSDGRISTQKIRVAAATEMAERLHVKIVKELAKIEKAAFIDEVYIKTIESNVPETGEMDRYTFAELTDTDPRLLRGFFQKVKPAPLRKESRQVTVSVSGKTVTRSGRQITRYPKALFLGDLVEHGSQILYDQRDKLLQGSVKTTEEIAATLTAADGRWNHTVPRIKPLQHEETSLPIDPYTLGAWLGDGDSRNGEICGIDPEVSEKVASVYPVENTKVVTSGSNANFRIWRFAKLKASLKEASLLRAHTSDSDTKRIPAEYFFASEDQKRELLRGLMDTDGTVDPDGMVSFTTVIPQLRDDFVALVRSLGYIPSMSSRIPTTTTTGKKGRRAYTIQFSADPEENIFHLSRKSEAHKERYKGGMRSNVRYIVSIEKVKTTEPVRCISVDSPSRLFLAGKSLVPTHNSVLQRNIVFHCIQHSDKWQFLGIDPKRVELSAYAKYDNAVLGIATNLEDGVEVMRFANEQMMERYTEMERMGVSNFLDMPDPPPALMVMIDEAYIFMATTGGKTDIQKEQDALHGEATVLVGDVARLGRAAGVHLVVATQRPDAKVIYGEIKANLPVRYMAGRSGSTPSLMVLETDTGTRVPGNIKGRGVISTNGDEEFIQGYFAPSSWIDEWLNSHDTNDGDSQLSEQMSDSLRGNLVTSDSQDLPEGKKRKKKKGKAVGALASEDDGSAEFDFSDIDHEGTAEEAEPVDNPDEAQDEALEGLLTPAQLEAQLTNLEDEEGDSFIHSAPSPASPAIIEDNEEDEDALFLNPQRETPRPTLKGNQVEEEEQEALWDDEMDSLVGDRNAPQPTRQPKVPAPSRPAPATQKPAESAHTSAQKPVQPRPAATPVPEVASPPASPLASPPKPPASVSKVARPSSGSVTKKESGVSLPALPPLPPRPKQK